MKLYIEFNILELLNCNKWKGCLIFALVFLVLFSYFLFFSQVTGSPALIFRHRDGSDLALYQHAAHSKDANVTFRRLPRPGALTLLWMNRPQGGEEVPSALAGRRLQSPCQCWSLTKALIQTVFVGLTIQSLLFLRTVTAGIVFVCFKFCVINLEVGLWCR